MKLGYAEVDITPDMPMELVGFYRTDNTSRGILKPLLAQITVWEEEYRYCLIAIDSIGFIKKLADKLRVLAGEALGTSADKVMLCFSHCHSAPNADISPEYFELVCRNIITGITRAISDAKSVLAGWENAEIDIGVNRREENINLDRRLGIFVACDSQSKKIKLLMLRVTAHCNVLKSDNYMISPDYFGNIRDLLRERYQCPVMVIQGAAGTVAPKYFDSALTPIDARGAQFVRSETALQDMANEVYQKLSCKMGKIALKASLPLQMYSKRLKLYANIPSLEAAKAMAIEANEKYGINGEAWLAEIEKLHSLGIYKQEEIIEVQYFAIGE